MTSAQVEKQLNELRRLPENKECLNCHSVSKMGHGNVCVPFKTFVCSDCKSAHQAFSHRIKSLTMSIWTQDEVDKLKPEKGGSNRNAEAMFFARYDERKLPRPRKGDDHTVWKDFIKQVYIDKRFYDDAGGDHDDDRHSSRRPERSHESSSSHRSKGRYDDDDIDDDYNHRSKSNGSRYSDDRHYDNDDRAYSSNSRSSRDDRRQNDSRYSDRYISHDDDSRSRGYDDGGRASGGSGGRDRRYVAGDDDDDGEVRTRRKDVGKSRLSSRTSRTADRVTPTSSSRHAPSASSSSGKNDLLGDWDAEPVAQLSNNVGALDLGGGGGADTDDGWADFAGASVSAVQAQHHSVQQNLFEATPQQPPIASNSTPLADFFGGGVSTTSPAPVNPSGHNTALKGDIMAMYSMPSTAAPAPAPQRPSPMGMGVMPAPGMGNMNSMAGMPTMGGMGGMHAPMMTGMQHGAGAMGGMMNPSVMGMGISMGGMGMGMGMQMRGPSPMQQNMGMPGGMSMAHLVQPQASAFARQISNEPSVFDLASNSNTPAKGAQKPTGGKDAKFDDLRW